VIKREEFAPDLLVMSFGTVHGEPLPQAHLVAYVDDWFADPHVSGEMRQMTGLDQPVVDNVVSQEGAFDYIEGLYRAVLPLLLLRKRTVVLVVACIGGRHRSVVIADEVAKIARSDNRSVQVRHPHVERPVRRR
jgi:UPF0042 nucleotide-binding protein